MPGMACGTSESRASLASVVRPTFLVNLGCGFDAICAPIRAHEIQPEPFSCAGGECLGRLEGDQPARLGGRVSLRQRDEGGEGVGLRPQAGFLGAGLVSKCQRELGRIEIPDVRIFLGAQDKFHGAFVRLDLHVERGALRFVLERRP